MAVPSLSFPICKMGPAWVSAPGKVVTTCVQSPESRAMPGVPATAQCSLALMFLGLMGQSHPLSDLSGWQGTFRNIC